jgi:hypothetical protein
MVDWNIGKLKLVYICLPGSHCLCDITARSLHVPAVNLTPKLYPDVHTLLYGQA